LFEKISCMCLPQWSSENKSVVIALACSVRRCSGPVSAPAE
jgi:hypothetical protein